MQFRRAAALAATWLLSSSLARQGFAAEGTPSVQLDYEAPAACPGADVFASALAARGVRVERAPELPTIRVRIRAEAAGFVGSLTISASSGPWLARDVGARDCAEIASAFALVAAVTAARGSPEPAVPTAPEAGPTDPSQATVEPLTEPAKEPAPRAPPAPATAPRALATSPPSLVTSPSERFDLSPPPAPPAHFAFGIGTQLAGGVLPEFGVGLLVFGERAWPSPSSFSPLLAFSLAWSRQEITRVGRARFDWVLLRTAACPWQWPRHAQAYLRPCAAVETGILRGEGINVRAANSSTGWWLAPGIELRGRAALGRIALGAAIGAFTPLLRDRFYFGPDVALHRPEILTLSSEITLGALFQ